MKCNDIEHLLPEYASDRLDAGMREIVKNHVASCVSCQRELAEIRALFETTEPVIVKDIEAPEGYFDSVWPALYKRIREEGLDKPKPSFAEWLRGMVSFAGKKSFQLANVAVIIVLSCWLFLAHQNDKGRVTVTSAPDNVTSILTEMSRDMNGDVTAPADKTPVENGATGEREGNDLLSDSALVVSPQSLEKLSSLLNPEKQQEMYDSLTDYLAKLLIKLDNAKT